jgi:hypothetical protein
MADLALLMKLMEIKQKDKLLSSKLEMKQDEGKMIKSLAEVEKEMTRQ